MDEIRLLLGRSDNDSDDTDDDGGQYYTQDTGKAWVEHRDR